MRVTCLRMANGDEALPTAAVAVSRAADLSTPISPDLVREVWRSSHRAFNFSLLAGMALGMILYPVYRFLDIDLGWLKYFGSAICVAGPMYTAIYARRRWPAFFARRLGVRSDVARTMNAAIRNAKTEDTAVGSAREAGLISDD